MSLRAACAAFAVLLSLAACGESEHRSSSSGSATMQAGENCNAAGCHAWTAAGTVYLTTAAVSTAGVAGATVHIDGTSSQAITTNAAGNFYTSLPFGSSATVYVVCGTGTKSMAGTISDANGGCGSCHGPSFRVHCP